MSIADQATLLKCQFAMNIWSEGTCLDGGNINILDRSNSDLLTAEGIVKNFQYL